MMSTHDFLRQHHHCHRYFENVIFVIFFIFVQIILTYMQTPGAVRVGRIPGLLVELPVKYLYFYWESLKKFIVEFPVKEKYTKQIGDS